MLSRGFFLLVSTAFLSAEHAIDLTTYISFETTHDLAFRKTFFRTTLYIGVGSLISSHPAQHHRVQGGISRARSSSVEPVSHHTSARCLDRRASDLDARNRGTRSVPQAVRAKRVRPLYFIHIRVCGYVHNHSRGRSGLTHTFIGPATQKRAHEERMRTYGRPVTQNVRMKNACAPTACAPMACAPMACNHYSCESVL